jgi:CheY-like chemotaxis protein
MPAQPAGARILVVDGDEGNRDVLVRRLSREGHAVSAAADGTSALDAMASAAPDLVLLDVMMPAMDGYEVLERMKAAPELRSIPVLVISALDDVASVVRRIDLGAEDSLGKPFDPVPPRRGSAPVSRRSGFTTPRAGGSGPSAGGEEQLLGGFHQCLGERRMGVNRRRDVLGERRRFHRQRGLGDQLARARSGDPDP